MPLSHNPSLTSFASGYPKATMLYNSELFLNIQLSWNSISWVCIMLYAVATYFGIPQAIVRSILKEDAEQRMGEIESNFTGEKTLERKKQNIENELYTLITFLSIITILTLSFQNLKKNYKDPSWNDAIDFDTVIQKLINGSIMTGFLIILAAYTRYYFKNPPFGENKGGDVTKGDKSESKK